jgi:hypothetical protein
MKSNTFLIDNLQVTRLGETIALKIQPADESDVDVLEHLRKIGSAEFALGNYNLRILRELISDLDLCEPIEIGLSLKSPAGRARLLFIRQGETKIYLAGMEYISSESEHPEPDALDLLQKENADLKARVAELKAQLSNSPPIVCDDHIPKPSEGREEVRTCHQ